MADNHGDPAGFGIKKKVDESWKDNVEKEKEAVEPARKPAMDPEPDAETPPELTPSFSSLVTTLGMQAFIALGEFQGPAAAEHAPSIDLAQAKSFIDLLRILSEKTKGNLTADEAATLQEILYGLQMKFIEKSGTS